jgi:hypothetical protein
MSLATLVRDASQRAARPSFVKREIRVVCARAARSAGSAVKTGCEFVLTIAFFGLIMLGLAALNVFIWIPRVH